MQKLTVLLVSAVCCMLLGCGISQGSYAPSSGMEAGGYLFRAAKAREAAATDVPVAADEAETPENSITENRKLVYKGCFTLVVGDITNAQDKTQQLAEQLGGYLQAMYPRTAVIRVPADRFKDAINKLGLIGSVAKRQISVQDVTENYVDLSTRLKNAHALSDRLRKLFDGAKTVKDSLSIERELARVQLEIDKIEGRLKLLSNRISYATLEIEFEGTLSYTPPQLRVKLPISWLSELGLNNLLRFGGRELY